MKFLKVLLKKYWYVKYFFFQNFAVYYLFFIFFIFDILSSISSICSCQKILEIFIFFILCIRDFIKEFLEIIECFLKKYRHLKSKVLHKFHRLLFVYFNSFSILVIFFPISPIQTCQKILNIFVVLYCTDYKFYQTILEYSSIFMKKNRDTLNTKYFQNFIAYYLLF